jgi:transcriptional regulator with XRE-family HTH domain
MAYNTPMDNEALKKWRLKHGYSQAQLADALQVDVMTISRWERGARQSPPFLRLALRALEMDKPRRASHGKHLQKR